MIHAVEADHTAGMDAELREQLSNLQGLLMLSMLMIESGDANRIMQLAASSLPSFGHFHMVGVHLTDSGWLSTVTPAPPPALRVQVAAQLSTVASSGGAITVPGEAWGWALPLRSVGGQIGYFVAAAPKEPSKPEVFLLRALAQQTGVALANAGMHAKERTTAGELRVANTVLAETVRALEQTTEIHDRFTRVAVASEGQQGIARALHELTGYPVAVEDRYGNLRAWAGPNQPEPYPKDPPARREQLLRRALREKRPIRESGRLVAIVSPAADVLGVLAIIDPGGAAGDKEQIALEHGATVLAMELARLRSIAETELRLRRDLAEELLAGTEEGSALARAQALGYDLERRHRVVVVEGRGRTQDKDSFFNAVRRAARETRVRALLVARGAAVVVISDTDVSWDRFRNAVLADLGGGRCSIGVGGWCDRPSDFPRSHREAQLALKMQHSVRGEDRATCYDDLGVYRILCEVEDPAAIERFVRQWLGALLDYDDRKQSELVPTLCRYLECGGSYAGSAAALFVHRSTLKYRLQRIREISGHDLTDPDTNFNLQLATRAWQTLQSLHS
jgi:DNA-binding PucR family transcriptional regulator